MYSSLPYHKVNIFTAPYTKVRLLLCNNGEIFSFGNMIFFQKIALSKGAFSSILFLARKANVLKLS